MSKVRLLIQLLQESFNDTLDKLSELADGELDEPCGHPCAMGGTVRDLLTHNIDHERMHSGAIYNIRYEGKCMQTGQVARLLAEWLRERTNLIAALIGLPDEELETRAEPDRYSFRETIEHVIYWEKDSIDYLVQEVRQRQVAGFLPQRNGRREAQDLQEHSPNDRSR